MNLRSAILIVLNLLFFVIHLYAQNIEINLGDVGKDNNVVEHRGVKGQLLFQENISSQLSQLSNIDSTTNGYIVQIDIENDSIMSRVKVENGLVQEYTTFSEKGTPYCEVVLDEKVDISKVWKILKLNEKIYPSWDFFFSETTSENYQWQESLTMSVGVFHTSREMLLPEDKIRMIEIHDKYLYSTLESSGGIFQIYDLKGQLRVHKEFKNDGSEPLFEIYDYYDREIDKIYSIRTGRGKATESIKFEMEDNENYYLSLYKNGYENASGRIKDGKRSGVWKQYDKKGKVIDKMKY